MFAFSHILQIWIFNSESAKDVFFTNLSFHKATHEMLINYQLNLHYNLSSLTEIIPTNRIEIDNYLDTIVQIIFYSSRCNIPKAHFVPHIKPYRTSEVKKAHKNARQKRKIWVSEGKPRGMVYEAYKNYKTAKLEFRSTQQKAIYDHEKNTFAD